MIHTSFLILTTMKELPQLLINSLSPPFKVNLTGKTSITGIAWNEAQTNFSDVLLKNLISNKVKVYKQNNTYVSFNTSWCLLKNYVTLLRYCTGILLSIVYLMYWFKGNSPWFGFALWELPSDLSWFYIVFFYSTDISIMFK